MKTILSILVFFVSAATCFATHTHGVGGEASGSGTSQAVTLSGAPTTGDTCIATLGVLVSISISGLTLTDSNNNSYTVIATPANQTGATLWEWGAYLLNAPSNATASLTASWTTSAGYSDIFVDCFHVSGGTDSFGSSAISATNAVSGAAGAITSPTITPAGSADLLYAGGIPNGNFSNPTQGSTQGVWTGGQLDVFAGLSEYDLSAGSATAVNITDAAVGDPYAVIEIDIHFTATGGGCTAPPTQQLLHASLCNG